MSTPEDAQVAGINSLPAELLLQIFIPLCLLPGTRHRSSLIAVCSRWKQLLLTTPAIWRSIRINSGEWASAEMYKRCLKRLEVQLGRSESQRLRVYLEIRLHKFHQLFQDLNLNLQPLARLLEQSAPFTVWESLILKHCSPILLNELRLERMGGFTNLRVLQIESLNDPLLPLINNTVSNSLQQFDFPCYRCPVNGQEYIRPISHILSLIDYLKLPTTFTGLTTDMNLPPNITELHLGRYVPNSDFPHVRSLTIPLCDSQEIQVLPTQFPNLQSLTLSIPYSPSLPSVPLVELPHLKHLTTHLLGYNLLNSIAAPRLRTLSAFTTSSNAAFPSSEQRKRFMKSGSMEDPAIILSSNLQPQERLLFLLPMPLHNLKSVFRHTTNTKRLGVLFSWRDDVVEILSCLFRSQEEYQEKEGSDQFESEIWEVPPCLVHLDLYLDCGLDDEMNSRWGQCASRFLASTPDDTGSLQSVRAIWSCGSQKKVAIQQHPCL